MTRRKYRGDEALEPVDAEMVRLGRATLKINGGWGDEPDTVVVVDNLDHHGSPLAAELMRERIAATLLESERVARKARADKRLGSRKIVAKLDDAEKEAWALIAETGWKKNRAAGAIAAKLGVNDNSLYKRLLGRKKKKRTL